MSARTQRFGEIAKELARNPLTIIALFIVLVYGFASQVMIFRDALTDIERIFLVCFLVMFPVLVLVVFAWLVSKHSDKLYSPSDFMDEDNYVRLRVAASLTAATTERQKLTKEEMREIANLVRVADPARPKQNHKWNNQLLWVDDQPENNTYERQAFEDMGLIFTLALSTSDAFEKLAQSQYIAIISDMSRPEGPKEGYVLLDRLREKGDHTPLFFYTSSNTRQERQEALDHDGQGYTNNPRELFEMVTRAVNVNSN